MPYPFYFTDRLYYDHFLLEEVKATGVTVLEGCKVIGLRRDGEKINVLTDEGGRFSCKYLVGADGVTSVVRKYIFSKSHRKLNNEWKKGLAVAFETFLKREKTNNFNSPSLFFGYVNSGYGWIFPNKDKLIAGIGALVKKNELIYNSFKEFLRDLALNHDKIYAYSIPFGNFITGPIMDRILLIGDSAGFVDPFTGEGIFYAHRSAEIAAYSIYESITRNENVSNLYIQLLNKYLYPELRHAKKLRSLIYSCASHLNWRINRLLLKRFADKLIKAVHGASSYNFLKSASSLRDPVWK